MSIIWSRPVGTMFHSTGSAWIQYSRAGPLTVKAASSVVPAPSAPSGRPPAAGAAAPRPPRPGRLGRRDLRRHGQPLGVGVDVDLPFGLTDLLPGQRAE